jgi:hypothetical protein
MAFRPILKLDQLVVRPQKVARIVARRSSAERVPGLRAEMKLFAAHGVSSAATMFVVASWARPPCLWECLGRRFPRRNPDLSRHSLPGAGRPSTSNRAATVLTQAQKRLGEGYAGGQMHPRVNALSSVAWQYLSAIRSWAPTVCGQTLHVASSTRYAVPRSLLSLSLVWGVTSPAREAAPDSDALRAVRRRAATSLACSSETASRGSWALYMPDACNVGLWPAAECCARGMTAGALTMAASLARFVVVTARRLLGPASDLFHRNPPGAGAFQTAIEYP